MTLNEEKIIALLLKHDEDIENIKYKMDTEMATKTDLNRLYDMMSKLTDVVYRIEDEQKVQSTILLRLVDKVEKHDDQILELQKAVFGTK